MTDEPSQTVVRAWARLMKAQRLALASIERALKIAGLPPLDWYDVLLEVERAGENGLRPFELERAMLLAQYNLSRLVDRVGQAGYVERRVCEEDGRGQLIAITPAGKVMRLRMWSVYSQAIESAVGQHLPGKEAETLDGLLGKLIEKNATGWRASASDSVLKATVRRASPLDQEQANESCTSQENRSFNTM